MSENQTSGLFTRLGIVIIVILQVAKTPPTRSDYPPKHRGISSVSAAPPINVMNSRRLIVPSGAQDRDIVSADVKHFKGWA